MRNSFTEFENISQPLLHYADFSITDKLSVLNATNPISYASFMGECTDKLEKYIKENNIKAIKKTLNSQTFDILKWRNTKGYTILHIFTLYCNHSNFDFIIDRIKLAFPSEATKELAEWLNISENNEQYNALHFAAIRGDIKILKKLISIGVDYKKKAKDGQNLLHIAAQSNQGLILYYLSTKMHMNLLEKDNSGRTPLHDACSITFTRVWLGVCSNIYHLADI